MPYIKIASHKAKSKIKLLTGATLCLLGVATLLLTSCSQPGATPHNTPKKQATIVTLTLSAWGATSEVTILRSLLAEFEARHPHITVRLSHAPDNYFQKLHILMAARRPPDVMMMNSLQAPVYVQAGQLANLAPLAQGQVFYQGALKAFSGPQANTLWALPRDVSTLVVFVNKALLRQAGQPGLPAAHWGWSQALRLGQQVRALPCQPACYGWSFYQQPPLFWLPFVWSWGGRWLTTPPQATEPATPWLKDTAALEGLQFYAALGHQYHVAPLPDAIGQTPMTQLFLQGRLAFLLSGRWTVPFLRQHADFDWDILPFPAGPAGSLVGVDATGYAVSQHTRNPAQARALAQFLTSPAALTAFAANGLITPARPSVATQLHQHEAANNLPPANTTAFLTAIKTGIPTRTPPNWGREKAYLQETLQPLFQTGQLQPGIHDE